MLSFLPELEEGAVIAREKNTLLCGSMLAHWRWILLVRACIGRETPISAVLEPGRDEL